MSGAKFQPTDLLVEERGTVAEISYKIEASGMPTINQPPLRWVNVGDEWYKESGSF